MPNAKNINVDCEHNLNDNDNFNAPDINPHGVIDRTLDCFVEEETLFNEWLQSCVQTNAIVMNSPFSELLNLFTDHGQCDNKLFNRESMNDMFMEQINVGQMFKGLSVSEERMIRVNDQPKRNADRSFRLSDDVRPGCSQVAGTSAVRDINGYTKNTDLEDISKKHTNQTIIMQPIGMRSSAIHCSNHNTTTDENSHLGKLDFNDLFQSQQANRYVDNFTERNTDLLAKPVTIEDDDSNRSTELLHYVNDDSNRSTELLNYVDDDNSSTTRTVVRDVYEDEDDEVIGNLDFEELFKSQRADRFIEKYSEEITTERPKANNSAVMCSKKTEMSHKGKIDYTVLFKSQRSNGYIEDFMVRNTESCIGPSNEDNLVVRHFNDDVNDDHSIADIETKAIVRDDDQDEDDEILGNIDFEKLYKSRKSEICIEKEIAAGRQNVDGSIANGGRKSPIVCGGGQKAGTSGYQSIGKIDYSVLFKSQRSNGYIEDFMIRNTGVRVPSAVDRDVLHNDDNDDEKDEGDEVMGNLDFEQLFKSQKLAMGMETDGSDRISAKRPNVGRSMENNGPKSPIVCGGGQKAKRVGRSGKVDYSALFKSQRSDEKVGVEDCLPGLDVPQVLDLDDNDNDDVISIKSSPEFFSCKPPKKVVQMKLMGRVRANRSSEIIDLLSPPSSRSSTPPLRTSPPPPRSSPSPPRSSGTANMPSVFRPISGDRLATDGVATTRVGGSNFLQLLDDDNDMDFMFIDYNSEGNAVTDVFTQKHLDGDVFAQKQRDGYGDTKFVAQKLTDNSGTKTAARLPLPPVSPVAKPPNKDDVTKRVGHSTQSYDSGMMPFNIMKAARLVDWLKPGLSMKRSTTTAASKRLVDNDLRSMASKRQVDNGLTATASKLQVDNGSTATTSKRQPDNGSTTPTFRRKIDNGSMAALAFKRKIRSPANDMSPIHPPNGPRRRPQFSQSTPKVLTHPKHRRRETDIAAATTVTAASETVNSMLTSSSDSDAFVGHRRDKKTTSPRRRVKKKRRAKPKKVSILIIKYKISRRLFLKTF